MCGITGIMAFNELGRMHMIHLAQATQLLTHRGPDYQNTFIEERVGLGHRRLSIIDLSAAGNQPMSDPLGRYTIVYNGELYNYGVLRQQLQNQGVTFSSQCDTEVVLQSYIHKGPRCLQDFNGCFALAIYDTQKEELFLARDRMGINPLLYFMDEDKFLFASEMKSILSYNIPKDLDYDSLTQYLQLNYLAAPETMIHGIKKLMPGTYMLVKAGDAITHTFYQIDHKSRPPAQDYTQQQQQLATLLEESVVKRLISDVPLGAFLSGGIDSSVITALASKHVDQLHTFSIGYRDQPYYDETKYAEEVAKKFNTRHTTFSLTNQELFTHLQEMWDHLGEPFADSSSLPTYILSKYTREHVTVALSGDGADEMLAGYQKHVALARAFNGGWFPLMAQVLAPIARLFPQGRHNFSSNRARQLVRFAEGLRLNVSQRYWFWASLATEDQVLELLSPSALASLDQHQMASRKQNNLQHLSDGSNMNDVLYTDMHLVLPNDMLTKVDLMSMAHSLEVRVPFLDHELVDFAFSVPPEHKIEGTFRKRILQDTFKEILPKSLYRRPKKGFEVPLLPWMQGELRGVIENQLLQNDFVREQGIFNESQVKALKRKLFSKNPQDTPARIWALLVFQNWWKQYFS